MVDLLFTLLIFNTSISNIEFIGNKSVAGRILTKDIISKKGEEYDDINLEFDSERIVRTYKAQGFFKSKVTPTAKSTEKGIDITFDIKEGERPIIEEVIINDGKKEKLNELIEIRINDFFIERKIKNTENNLENYYKNHGYTYADVRSRLKPDSGIVVFDIEKGLFYYIRNIEIQGLKVCNPKVVRREIEFNKGDGFNKSKLLMSQRRIYGLGFFSTVNAEILRQEPDSIDLIFRVRELKSRILNFGVGLSIPLSFLISFGMEERNLFNLGHRFRVEPSFKINIKGEWETKLEGRYTIPYVTRMKLTISVLPFFWFEETDEFTRQTRGNEFRISKLFTENIQFSIANQYKFVDFRPKIELPDTMKGVTNSIKFQLMMDYRDEFFNPTKGLYVLPLVEYAGGIFGGANDFIRLEVEKRLFLPLLKHTLAQRLKLGVIIPTNGIATYEKYYMGGQYSLRGYPEKAIGPDSIADEKYGNILGNYNIEYRITLPKNFGIVGFFDVGYIDNKLDFKQSDFLKASAGFGLRYNTPIGPIRLDLGFPIANEGKELYFGIYHIF